MKKLFKTNKIRKVRWSLFSMILVCSMVLAGCGITESSELISGARKFIENGEYDKAMTNLSKVLDEDEANSEARGMYYQALKLKKAQRYAERKNYEQEIKELQDLLNDNSGSSKVRAKAEDMLANAQELLKNQNRAVITRKENAKKTAEENKNKYRTYDVYRSTYVHNSFSTNANAQEQNNQGANATTNGQYGQNGQGSHIGQNGQNAQNGQNVPNGQAGQNGQYGQRNTYKNKYTPKTNNQNQNQDDN